MFTKQHLEKIAKVQHKCDVDAFIKGYELAQTVLRVKYDEYTESDNDWISFLTKIEKLLNNESDIEK